MTSYSWRSCTEVEMVLNSRPLSYIAADNLEEPLTPPHLLSGRRLMTNPDCLTGGQVDDEETFEIEPDGLTMRVKHLNHTLDRFWCRWRREYLTNLREAHKIHSKNSSAPRVSVGDVVTIHEDGQPRGMWKLGLVENLLVGRDQEVRAAVLRVPGRGRNIQHLSRPVQKLYPLEIPKEKNCIQIRAYQQKTLPTTVVSIKTKKLSHKIKDHLSLLSHHPDVLDVLRQIRQRTAC